MHNTRPLPRTSNWSCEHARDASSDATSQASEPLSQALLQLRRSWMPHRQSPANRRRQACRCHGVASLFCYSLYALSLNKQFTTD